APNDGARRRIGDGEEVILVDDDRTQDRSTREASAGILWGEAHLVRANLQRDGGEEGRPLGDSLTISEDRSRGEISLEIDRGTTRAREHRSLEAIGGIVVGVISDEELSASPVTTWKDLGHRRG